MSTSWPRAAGKLRLAMLVQYLPLPVVGGYLAFIGLYCLEAGLSLMTGMQVRTPTEPSHLYLLNRRTCTASRPASRS